MDLEKNVLPQLPVKAYNLFVLDLFLGHNRFKKSFDMGVLIKKVTAT